MVKRLIPIFFLVIVFSFLTDCNVDLLGLIVSTDLDERLREKDNLIFLEENGWITPEFGSEYSFIVLTDTHLEKGNDSGFGRIAGVIDDTIKFVVVVGDLTQHGSGEDIDTFIEKARSFGVPCYPVIGNHDIYFGKWSVWKEKIGSTRYRINEIAGTTTLFVLDTANAFYGNEQLDWLEREIKSAQGHVFVFTHSNLFVDGPVDVQQTTDIRERARVISILQNRCDAMFMGHVHKRVVHETGNVRYITIEDFKSSHVYCLVTVNNSGVTCQFKKL